MKKNCFSIKLLLYCIPVIIYVGCKVPYDPPLNTSPNHFLVVDGFINSDGVTNVKLSRTRNITSGDTAAYINEPNARVVIEDDRNDVYPLSQTGDGNYSGAYYLYPNNNYRLHIFTADHKEYVSDFVPCKQSPPIDKIGWKFRNGNVQIFVNTHDPNNSTRFYRWDYVETWEFHSDYNSTFIYDPLSKKVIKRTVPVNVCYRSTNANKIFIGSTLKLKDDVISEASLDLIPNHDRRIGVLYSTLVTQYALDSAGYNYWNAMKGNTENVGSIFDPQPNQTIGNVHCVSDSLERVIGYIGAGTISQSRLFISNGEMPWEWNQPNNCSEYYVPRDSVEFYFSNNSLIPYESDPRVGPMPKGYFSASGTCVDCTITGSLDKPIFWP